MTFGCQMNKLDSEMLHAALESSGWVPVDEPDDAEVLIYNTCSVRRHAEDRVMSNIGRWRKKAESNQHFMVGVVGCMAQRVGEDIMKKYPFVRFVCGTRAFLNVPQYIDEICRTGGHITALEDSALEYERDPSAVSGHYHAYVGIMRGCSNYCTYCIVPYVRGPEVSRPIDTIVDEAGKLVESGVVEITLLGQNVNAYGRHPGNVEGAEGGLPELLGRLNQLPGLKRIRFVTSHPKDMSEDILHAVVRNPNVCEHLHMPIQSASDRVLKAMNRKYNRKNYMGIVEKAEEIIPNIALSSDFIVGFPGETDEEFQHTLSLLEHVGFQQSYIFRYSPRPGTDSEKLPDDVPDEVKRERQQILLAAQKEADIQRRRRLIGETVEVMCVGENTSQPHEGAFSGRTRHNDIVIFGEASDDTEPGGVRVVKIRDATALTLFGDTICE